MIPGEDVNLSVDDLLYLLGREVALKETEKRRREILTNVFQSLHPAQPAPTEAAPTDTAAS